MQAANLDEFEIRLKRLGIPTVRQLVREGGIYVNQVCAMKYTLYV
jgi:hypothetical protein